MVILGVLILAGLANRHRLHKLKLVDQFVMMYGGLRGAVAFALVLLIDKKVIHLVTFYGYADIIIIKLTANIANIFYFILTCRKYRMLLCL